MSQPIAPQSKAVRPPSKRRRVTRPLPSRGMLLAIIGLVLGITLGLSFKAGQRILVNQLIGILQDELDKACAPSEECRITYDDFNLSLTELTATVDHIKIDTRYGTALWFDQVKASFGIDRLLSDHIIDLSHLQLVYGHAEGIDEDSVVYRFIDQLSTSPPPEVLADEDRFRLQLQSLSVYDTTARQQFEETTVGLSGAQLYLTRNQDDLFVLYPTVQEIRLSVKGDKPGSLTHYVLGKTTTKIVLEDEDTVFKNLFTQMGATFAAIEATANIEQGNALDGQIEARLDSYFLHLEDWLIAEIDGRGALHGSLGNPGASGSFTNTKDMPASIKAGDFSLLTLSTLNGDFTYDLNRGDQRLSIEQLTGKGPKSSIEQTAPFLLEEDNIEGAFTVAIEQFTLGPLDLRNLNVQLGIAGTSSQPRLSLEAEAENVFLQTAPLGPLRFSLLQETDSEWGLIVRGPRENTARYNGKARLSLSTDGAFFLEPFSLAVEDAPLWYSPESPESFLDSLRMTGSVSMSGELSQTGMKLTAPLQVTARHFEGEDALTGTVQFESGVINARFKNFSEQASLALRANVVDPTDTALLSFDITALPAAWSTTEENCIDLGLKGSYRFSSDAPTNGNGNIELNQLAIGCEPLTLGIGGPIALPLRSGALILPQVALKNADSSLQLNGSISLTDGYNLQARGALDLAAFLAFVPVDTIKGALFLDGNLEGSFTSPQFSGNGSIDGGELTVESADLNLYNLTGSFALEGSTVTTSDIQGILNQGQIEANGSYDLTDSSLARGFLKFVDVELEPTPSLFLRLDGDLSVAPSESGLAALSGYINVSEAVAEQSFNLQSIVGDLVSSTFSRKRSSSASSSSQATLAPAGIELEVEVSAPRNIFIDSNLVTAELNAALSVSGTSDSPRIEGSLEVLEGWFAISGTRFDISSGALQIDPDTGAIRLDVLGEALFFDPQGGTTFVLAEGQGGISDLQFRFTSDDDRSQQEILAMLTTGQQLSTYSQLGNSGSLSRQNNDTGESSPIDFLYDLARIDSIGIDPTYNDATGLIEPALVAEKYLGEEVSLRAQSFVGSSVSGTTFQLTYNVLDDVALIGSVNTALAERQTSIGADVLFTLFERRLKYLEITIEGNQALSDRDLLKSLRISDTSRIPVGSIEAIRTSLSELYRERGFFDAETFVTCHRGTTYCRELSMGVVEGSPTIVTSISLEGDELPKSVNAERALALKPESIATRKLREGKAKLLVRALRNEGYIGARVRSRYDQDETNQLSMKLSVARGAPVTFVFPEQMRFTEEEFLETINLFERKQPFGRNTINLLIQNMEQLYQEAGYLYTTINYRKEQDPESGRITFYIAIQDEERVPVQSVDVRGNEVMSREALFEGMRERLGEAYASFASPEVALRDSLSQFSEMLQEVYADLGYPEAAIDAELIDGESGVDILYNIDEGEPFRARRLRIFGWPDNVAKPEQTEALVSIPKINQYLQSLQDLLRSRGYLHSLLQTSLDPDSDVIDVRLAAGTLTTIEDITIRGDFKTAEKVIRRHLSVSEGSPWDSTEIGKSRKALLRLGLFSRVKLEPLDGTLDEDREHLLVQVVERSQLSLKLGGGFDSELGAHVIAQATDKGFFADGRTISFTADTYYDPAEGEISQGTANARFTDPYLFDSKVRYVSDLRFQKRNLATLPYDLNRALFSNQLSLDLPYSLRFSIGHSLIHDNVEDVTPEVQLSELDSGSVRLSLLDTNLTFDRRDNPLNPQRGFFVSGRARLSSRALYSEADFLTLGGRFSFIVPLGDSPFSLGNNTRLGASFAYGNTSEIPLTQRFFTGGRISVRGFRDNSLGPSSLNGTNVGGDTLFINNTELRYKAAERVSLFAFWDMGGASLREDSIFVEKVRHSVGLGVRYLSPIGPIGLDVGAPVHERDGEPSVRVHFNVGSTF